MIEASGQATVPEIQVVLPEAIQPAFEQWLASRDLHLFRIPRLANEDLPTYAIGTGQRERIG